MRNITTDRKFAMKGGHDDITANEVLRIPALIRDVHIFVHANILMYIFLFVNTDLL